MSLLLAARLKAPVYERLRQKGALTPDEVEVLEELGILKAENNEGRG